MSTIAQRSGGVRLVGLITIIAGVIMIIAGGVTWGAVSNNLDAERITVSPDADAFGGQKVTTPWTAFSQAAIINHHAQGITKGETYATLGEIVNGFKDKAKAAAGADEAKSAMIDKLDIPGLTAAGASPEVLDLAGQAAAAQGQRTTVMNASFLRASLFTSVVAFGVALLVMGLGILFVVVGWALRRLAGAEVVTGSAAAPATVPATV